MAFALITGASKGIGKSMAFEMAARGYSLVLVARSEDLLQQTATEIGSRHNVPVKYLGLDLSSPTAARQLFDWTVQQNITVSVLINNAGYGLSGAFDSYPLERHRDMLQVNCTTLIELCHLFLPSLKSQPKAYILNIASSAAYQ
ncbi:MAG TPA: SDR family NAD(P)-dependent oxidoreductase, partial [Flavisolibacter sp.]|nr:SDR family NAD(P)-dependent oxidoreductase [Flavisolibacter sp.]